MSGGRRAPRRMRKRPRGGGDSRSLNLIHTNNSPNPASMRVPGRFRVASIRSLGRCCGYRSTTFIASPVARFDGSGWHAWLPRSTRHCGALCTGGRCMRSPPSEPERETPSRLQPRSGFKESRLYPRGFSGMAKQKSSARCSRFYRRARCGAITGRPDSHLRRVPRLPSLLHGR